MPYASGHHQIGNGRACVRDRREFRVRQTHPQRETIFSLIEGGANRKRVISGTGLDRFFNLFERRKMVRRSQAEKMLKYRNNVK